MAGSPWELKEEGAAPFEEPQFSTWEDVVNGKKAGGNGKKAGGNGGQEQGKDTTYYRSAILCPWM